MRPAVYLKAAVIYEFLKGNDKLETLIFCNSSKIRFITTDQSLYEALGSLDSRNTDISRLIKLLEVTELLPFNSVMRSDRKILTEERVDEIRSFEFDEEKFSCYIDDSWNARKI